jgi:hypothetical protein
MPRNAQSIISEALAISKTGNIIGGAQAGYTIQALAALNSVLDFLSETVDFARATRQFYFTFAPSLVTLGGGNIITAAANPLPIDYQRVQTSGGSTGAQRSTKWYFQGVPYDMVEIDLTEWDDQVMQPGIQSYPYFCTKDMSGGAIQYNFQGDINSTSLTVQNVSSINQLTGAITVGVPTGLAVGMTLSGGTGPITPIVPGTTITAINTGANTLTLSTLPVYLNGSPGTAWSGTQAQASLMAGYSANLLIYPPPSGAFNAMIRYQAYMPPLTQAQVNAGSPCWFPEDNTLIDLLSKRLMAIADDSRMPAYYQYANEQLGRYRQLVDDRANRAQTVQMDRRQFGRNFNNLPNTKIIGW